MAKSIGRVACLFSRRPETSIKKPEIGKLLPMPAAIKEKRPGLTIPQTRGEKVEVFFDRFSVVISRFLVRNYSRTFVVSRRTLTMHIKLFAFLFLKSICRRDGNDKRDKNDKRDRRDRSDRSDKRDKSDKRKLI